jgi:hypothetical protein
VPQQKLCHFLRKKRAGRKWWPVLAHRASFKTCSCPNLIPIETSQLEGFKISRTTTVRQPLNLPTLQGSNPKNLGTSPVSTLTPGSCNLATGAVLLSPTSRNAKIFSALAG